jgi:hypothetical protein
VRSRTGKGVSSSPVLTQRSLNRALLERQLLLRRSRLSIEKAVQHLVGMQAQATNPPYFGLWTRLEGFQPEALSRFISRRRVVRIALMRSTIHLVTADDCLALRPLLQPVLERSLFVGSSYGRALAGMDIPALVAAGRALVEEKPRTLTELGELLQDRWPKRDARSLAYAIRNLVPLVQVPPRGLWGASGQAASTTAERWLGRDDGPDSSIEELILRYLAVFGPASVKDVQTWSGLTRLRETVERLRPRLRTFRDEHGVELFDVPGAPLPEPDVPVPPRFLPDFDNVLLSHADRTRIISEEHRKAIGAANGLFLATFLVDGFVRGTWKLEGEGERAALVIRPFTPLSKSERATLAEEGERLLAFAEPDVRTPDVRFVPPK